MYVIFLLLGITTLRRERWGGGAGGKWVRWLLFRPETIGGHMELYWSVPVGEPVGRLRTNHRPQNPSHLVIVHSGVYIYFELHIFAHPQKIFSHRENFISLFIGHFVSCGEKYAYFLIIGGGGGGYASPPSFFRSLLIIFFPKIFLAIFLGREGGGKQKNIHPCVHLNLYYSVLERAFVKCFT